MQTERGMQPDYVPPAIFLPRLSCVTFRTARHLADQDLIKKPLKMMDGRDVATMGGSVDPLLELEDLLLEESPGRCLHSSADR
jgi:hypothetical protein